jgi:hypothetical protein
VPPDLVEEHLGGGLAIRRSEVAQTNLDGARDEVPIGAERGLDRSERASSRHAVDPSSAVGDEQRTIRGGRHILCSETRIEFVDRKAVGQTFRTLHRAIAKIENFSNRIVTMMRREAPAAQAHLAMIRDGQEPIEVDRHRLPDFIVGDGAGELAVIAKQRCQARNVENDVPSRMPAINPRVKIVVG